MEKFKKILNKIYLIFLIIVLILVLIFSFRTGKQMYYLVNTNLNAEEAPVNAKVANWKFRVRIEY